MSNTGDSDADLMPYYPDVFGRRDDILAKLTGQGTPLFVADAGILRNRYEQLAESLQRHWGPYTIGYSFKTNYLAARTQIFQQLGAFAEVVSAREYELARELGYAGSQIIFNGPHKPDASLSRAVEDGAMLHVNDQDELERLIALVPSASVPLEIGLRVGMDLPRLGHSRFGFSLENGEALHAIDTIVRSGRLRLVGLHTHLYGDTDDAELYRMAAERLARFAAEHVPRQHDSLKFLDVGGGFPAHSPRPKSRTEWNPQPIDVYIRAIASGLRAVWSAADKKRPRLVVEPGRYLTCDGIVLASRVVHVKERGGEQLVNTDASLSMVPLTHYSPQIIRAFDAHLVARETAPVKTTIYGATCRENDRLYEGVFPRVARDDYLLHFAAGAYNSSLSPDFIFAAPALEVI